MNNQDNDIQNSDMQNSDIQNSDIILAHKQSIYHREQIESSTLCGCFSCLKIYPPSEIKTWVDKETTALCAYCEIDSVIGDASNHSITLDFLTAMQKHWFLDEFKF